MGHAGSAASEFRSVQFSGLKLEETRRKGGEERERRRHKEHDMAGSCPLNSKILFCKAKAESKRAGSLGLPFAALSGIFLRLLSALGFSRSEINPQHRNNNPQERRFSPATENSQRPPVPT
jgi:hypothetical protein